MKSAKEKLDEKLGIKNINEIFDQSEIDAILNDSKIEIQKIDNQIKNKSELINQSLDNKHSENLTIQENNNLINSPIYTMGESLKEISYLITKSKDIITNLYSYITKTDFIDPDTISATAKMIEASRIVISDYIELYKEKARMIHEFNLENLKHKNKLELEEHKALLKHKYSLKDDNEQKTVDMIAYSQEQTLNLINDNYIQQ